MLHCFNCLLFLMNTRKQESIYEAILTIMVERSPQNTMVNKVPLLDSMKCNFHTNLLLELIRIWALKGVLASCSSSSL